MPGERVQRQIDNLLDECEETFTRGEWDNLRQAANKLLLLDPDNQDATVYAEAASRALASTDDPHRSGSDPPRDPEASPVERFLASPPAGAGAPRATERVVRSRTLEAPALLREPERRAMTRPSRYRSARTRAIWVQIAFAVFVAAALFSIWATWAEIDVIQRIQRGEPVSAQDAQISDDRVAAAGMLYLGALAFAVVTFCIWTFRAYSNLMSFGGAPPRFSPGWAVGWWFVPFMNLFRPYQVRADIAERSDPSGRGSSAVRRWWWGLWIIGGIVAGGVARLFEGETTLEELVFSDWRDIVAGLMLIVTAILAVVLVRSIVNWQDERAAVSRMSESS